MSVGGVGGARFGGIEGAGDTAQPGSTPAAAGRGGSAVREVYDRWERALNETSRIFGKDRELDQLSEKVVDAKKKAFADGTLTRAEMDSLRTEMDGIERAWAELAAKRGYPPGAVKPASREQFRVHGEQAEIQFQWIAGKDLRSGALGDLVKAVNKKDGGAVSALARKIALDIATSPSEAVATDKVHLLRAQLALVGDRNGQRETLVKVRTALEQTQRGLGVPGALSPAAFDRVARFESTAAVHETKLPDALKGDNKLFPNKPIPGWEAEVRKATKASLDDLSKDGKLFLDKVPAGSGPKTVAMKLDLNLGIDGPPSVTDPAATGATLAELLDRAKAQGKEIAFTVGDSSGGENIPLGRKSMDIMRDTGNYHHALKAGLAAAARDGSEPAKASLRKIEDAERRGVYFGSKDDKASTPADLEAAEDAAKKYVLCVDYDDAGWKSVDPKLGPLGLAAWGTREFQIAKPWADADYRVHVARGISTHTLAAWTGPTKGLIGLHAFGLRPADQSANKMGQDSLTLFRGISQATGFGAVLAGRTGLKVDGARLTKWNALKESAAAWKIWADGTHKLGDELERDKRSGMSEVALNEKMRSRTREILDRADAKTPGFRQALWDAAHETTRTVMVAGRNFRGLIPNEVKDEALGARIGLLTSLPYPSDLVLTSQPKVGEGGGPDAYHTVRDVGVVIAGTDEPTVDAVAWSRSGKAENLWAANYPVHASLRYGRGPMHLSEVRDISGR